MITKQQTDWTPYNGEPLFAGDRVHFYASVRTRGEGHEGVIVEKRRVRYLVRFPSGRTLLASPQYFSLFIRGTSVPSSAVGAYPTKSIHSSQANFYAEVKDGDVVLIDRGKLEVVKVTQVIGNKFRGIDLRSMKRYVYDGAWYVQKLDTSRVDLKNV